MAKLTDFVTATKRKLKRKRRVTIEEVPTPGAESPNPYMLDEGLETAAQPNRPPTHKIAKGAMRHSGLLSMIRNRGNRQVIDPEEGL